MPKLQIQSHSEGHLVVRASTCEFGGGWGAVQPITPAITDVKYLRDCVHIYIAMFANTGKYMDLLYL